MIVITSENTFIIRLLLASVRPLAYPCIALRTMMPSRDNRIFSNRINCQALEVSYIHNCYITRFYSK